MKTHKKQDSKEQTEETLSTTSLLEVRTLAQAEVGHAVVDLERGHVVAHGTSGSDDGEILGDVLRRPVRRKRDIPPPPPPFIERPVTGTIRELKPQALVLIVSGKPCSYTFHQSEQDVAFFAHCHGREIIATEVELGILRDIALVPDLGLSAPACGPCWRASRTPQNA